MGWREGRIVDPEQVTEGAPSGWQPGQVTEDVPRGAPTGVLGGLDRFSRGLGNMLAEAGGLVPGAAMELGNLTGLTDFEDTSGANLIRRHAAPLGLTEPPGQEARGAMGRAGEFTGVWGSVGVGGLAALGRYGGRGLIDDFSEMAVPAAREAVGASRRFLQRPASDFRWMDVPAGRRALQESSQLPGTARRLLDDTAEGVARAPTLSGAGELTSAAGAGFAGGLAEAAYGEGDWRVGVAEIAGGLGGGAVSDLGRQLVRTVDRATELLPGKHIVRHVYGKITGTPPTSRDARRTAAQRVLELTGGDPQRVMRRLDEAEALPGSAFMSGAEASDSPGLRRLAAEIRKREPGEAAMWRHDIELLNRSLLGELRSLAGEGTPDPAEAVRVLNRAREEFTGRLDDTVTLALGAARQEIEKLGPRGTFDDAAKIIATKLRQAETTAKRGVRAAYDAAGQAAGLPAGAAMPATLASSSYQRLLQVRPTSDHRLIPGYVREELGPEGRLAREFGDNVPLFELDGLRSRILGDAAEAGHAGNNAKASMLGDIAAGLRDDMDRFVGGVEGSAGEALQQARALAKETFDTFDTDALRQIMATSGGRDRPRTDPVISLERTVGSGGRPAGVYVRQIQDALARHGEDATGPISDIIRDDFVRGFESRGVQGAQRALNNYRDVLDRIPGLRDEFETALQGVFNADQLADRVAQIKSRMGDPAYSRAQVFLSGVGDGLNIDQGIQNIIRSRNPAAVSRDIMNRLRRDPTGEAVDGFRSAFVDHLIREATVSPAQLDGGSVVDGSLFNQLIGRGALLSEGQRPPSRRALEEVFTPNQMRRLDEIGDAFNRMRQDVHATPLGQRPITDGPGLILDNLASFSGLLLASKAGGNFNIGAGQLRLSQQGSKLIRDGVARGIEDPARRLISDAVLSNDKRLLRSLLVDASNEQEMARAGRRLNAWLAEQGPHLDTDEVMERLDQLTELGVPDFGLAEGEWWKDIEIRGGSREGGTLGEVLGR